MGANYDMIVARTFEKTDISIYIGQFLSAHELDVHFVGPLDALEINNDKAVLIGPTSSGWRQAVASPSSLRIGLAAWYTSNPLALYLSNSVEHCVHAWSLDSGVVAGYSLYSRGQKNGCEWVFCKSARDARQLMPGVPAPPEENQHALSALLGEEYNFKDHVSTFCNLEIGLAAFVSRFGFDVHLVDFQEAVDEKKGIAIIDGEYRPVDVASWNVVLFGL